MVLLARGRRGERVEPDRFERVLVHHDRIAGLEAWRATGEAAAVTRAPALAEATRRRATLLLDRAGDLAPRLGRWIDQELERLGLS
jgi:hypothetical protein